MRLRLLGFCLLMLCLALPASAREAGWVPLPDKSWQPPASDAPVKAKKPRKTQEAAQVVQGDTVYANQPAVTEPELLAFVATLPAFRAWAKSAHEEAHPIVGSRGQADFAYSPKAAQWLKDRSFVPGRFFCIMGRMAACLAIIEEGNDLKNARPRDMPEVSDAEISLARRHLGELLAAGGAHAPIN